MSVKADPVAAAIDDARAFMDALLQSDWQELHVANDDFELFIARDDGGYNPMFASVEEAPPKAPVHAAKTVTIAAPHVATIVWVARPGTSVGAGEPLARLSVLDEEVELKAERGGRIVSAEAGEGQLVEYGMTILQMTEEA